MVAQTSNTTGGLSIPVRGISPVGTAGAAALGNRNVLVDVMRALGMEPGPAHPFIQMLGNPLEMLGPGGSVGAATNIPSRFNATGAVPKVAKAISGTAKNAIKSLLNKKFKFPKGFDVSLPKGFSEIDMQFLRFRQSEGWTARQIAEELNMSRFGWSNSIMPQQVEKVMKVKQARAGMLTKNTRKGEMPFRVTFLDDANKPMGHVDFETLDDAAGFLRTENANLVIK